MSQVLTLDLLRLISTNAGLSIGAARKQLGVSQSQLSRVITLLGVDQADSIGVLEVRDVDGAQRLYLTPAGSTALLEQAPES
jgi:hypothetical protein